MTESKITLTERWRREGREEEASRYRDEVREQLRAEGKSKAEAREMSWERAREKYPPLPPAENPPESPRAEPAAQGDGPDTTEEEPSPDGKRWVAEWFDPVPSIAKWEADHGITLTDDALRELLGLVGFHFALSYMLGARGDRPKGFAHRPFTDVAALIDLTFEELAEVIDADMLHDLRPAEPAESPPQGQ